MAKRDENEQPVIDVNVHRRVLGFVNAARSPKDLMTAPLNEILLIDELVMEADEALHHDELNGHREGEKRKPHPDAAPLLERDLAKRILQARDDYNPVHGFRHISQLQRVPGFNRAILDRLIKLFSPRFRGKWEVLYADAD